MKDGGSAFPMQMPIDSNGNPTGASVIGMSLRDYFAAKAMQAIMYKPKAGSISEEELSNMAYRYADAMLKQREVDTEVGS